MFRFPWNLHFRLPCINKLQAMAIQHIACKHWSDNTPIVHNEAWVLNDAAKHKSGRAQIVLNML